MIILFFKYMQIINTPICPELIDPPGGTVVSDGLTAVKMAL